jgi:hypothetical protein
VVIGHFLEPANRPPPASPEEAELVANLAAYAGTLAARGDPLADSFRDLRDENAEESEPETEEVRGRRVEVPISSLNELDLLAWVRDLTWDLENRRSMAAELARREAAGEIHPANRTTTRTVLAALEI